MELRLETLHDFIVESEDAGEDGRFDQFVLIDVYGIYMVIHTFEREGRIDQEMIAYDNLQEAKDYLERKGISFSMT